MLAVMESSAELINGHKRGSLKERLIYPNLLANIEILSRT